jgi:gliding motility-associated-like protein
VVLEAYNEICDVTEQFTAEVQVGLGPIVTELIIPNVFTPNNDNKNRLFRVAYAMEEEVLPEGRNFFDYLSMYRLLIYNRWGNLVYDSDVDGLQGWDGGDNRDDTESTFYFILEYQRKCLDEAPIRREGHLTLLRK